MVSQPVVANSCCGSEVAYGDSYAAPVWDVYSAPAMDTYASPVVDSCCGGEVLGGVVGEVISNEYVGESYPVEGTVVDHGVIEGTVIGSEVIDGGTTSAVEPTPADPMDVPTTEDAVDTSAELDATPADDPMDDLGFGEDTTTDATTDAAADDGGFGLDDTAPADDALGGAADDSGFDDFIGGDDAADAGAGDGFLDSLDADTPADDGGFEDFLDESTRSEPKRIADTKFVSESSIASSEAEAPVRLWTDNTGRYQTVGKLVRIGDGHIRILKENGHFTTVPKTRLSDADLRYVQQMTDVMGIQTFEVSVTR
ncbi:MAG: SHD1 domain-containing protein [Pirellulaceae bacterium]